MTNADRAWVVILAFVVGYDVAAIVKNDETLSGAFDRALRSRKGSILTVLAWGALTQHLFDPAIRRAIQREQL